MSLLALILQLTEITKPGGVLDVQVKLNDSLNHLSRTHQLGRIGMSIGCKRYWYGSIPGPRSNQDPLATKAVNKVELYIKRN